MNTTKPVEQAHSPLPWHVDTTPVNPHTIHFSGGCVAECTLPPLVGESHFTWAGHSVYETEANAALIVIAVNAHARLLAENQSLREALRLAEQHLRFLSTALPSGLAACQVCAEVAEKAKALLTNEAGHE
jgi:hypothetical protein